MVVRHAPTAPSCGRVETVHLAPMHRTDEHPLRIRFSGHDFDRDTGTRCNCARDHGLIVGRMYTRRPCPPLSPKTGRRPSRMLCRKAATNALPSDNVPILEQSKKGSSFRDRPRPPRRQSQASELHDQRELDDA